MTHAPGPRAARFTGALVALSLWIPPALASSAPTPETRSPWPARHTLLLSVEAGLGHAVAADRSSMTHSAGAGGNAGLGLLWRPVDWVAAGLQLGFGGLPVRRDDASTVWTAEGQLVGRFLWPLGRVALWLDLGVGFGALTQTVRFVNARRITTYGPSLGAGLGIDVFVHRRLSIGAALRATRTFGAQYCLDSACDPLGRGLDHGLLLRGVVSVTYHLPLRRAHRRR